MPASVPLDRSDRGPHNPWSGLIWFAASAASVAAFYALGELLYGNQLDLGSRRWPRPGYAVFVGSWFVFGSVAAVTAARGLSQFGIDRLFMRVLPDDRRGTRAWILSGCALALAFPVGLRLVVLNGAPLTDDESCYRFMAELLATGRLWVDSPPLKLFFDRAFMINDGHFYTQYFVGWPALLVPGVLLGATGMMNAVYAALTVPALFLVLRRLAGTPWAGIGLVLYLASPMLMIGASTELSHTSCLMALAWLTWFVLRARDDEAPWWAHAGVACLFGLAFFIRPSSTVGIGLPLLVWWMWSLASRTWSERARALVSFVVPAALFAALFLGVNYAQNGSPWKVSYDRMHEYYEENDYRFSGAEFVLDKDFTHDKLQHFSFLDPLQPLTTLPIALGRLNFAVFGWPSSFLFVLALWLARRRFPQATPIWFSLACFLAFHMFAYAVGVDTFGPVHFFEPCWPLLLLSILGVKSVAESGWGVPFMDRWLRFASVHGLLLALIGTAWVGYAPLRLAAIHRIAENVNMPRQAAEDAGLHNAVIFASRWFARACHSKPSRHWVHWRDNNDPDLTQDVLWVNHVNLDENRKLMEHFPGREGYQMIWRQCKVGFVDLDQATVEEFPQDWFLTQLEEAGANPQLPTPARAEGAPTN